ncbi:MAG: magnesium-protoporphyrin IX monomethyl ester anaerobic oxidative cyclase [Rhodocyclaceae bacterium]
MKIVLVNPPHTAIGSRIPREHLPPLGLLSIGGPLLDAGFAVSLVDADLADLALPAIVEAVQAAAADVVMLGHSGSSSVHDTVVVLCDLLKAANPELIIVYGGVHPTYHWDEILAACPAIDFIVRGEGEETTTRLMRALCNGAALADVAGIAYRQDGEPVASAAATMIMDLDSCRVAWELIDHKRYSYWGGKRAVVAQFSRGCPYLCSYCGQRGFWTTWRHRDPVRFAKELAQLHREQGVELINFADELPTGSRKAWRAFLEALIAEDVPLLLVGSTRASDIVRDADILHLYRRAGVIRFLLGIESYDEDILRTVKKGSHTSEDAKAIALMRQHGIISMATYVVDFKEQTDRDYWRSYRHLLRYDPDQVQLLYATPHRWTPYYATVQDKKIIQADTRRWDYKHQVLESVKVPPWRVFLWFKCIEVAMQMRPKAIARVLLHPDADFRHAMRWYTRIGRRVWCHEVFEFLFRTRHLRIRPTLERFLGKSLAEREYALARQRKSPQAMTVVRFTGHTRNDAANPPAAQLERT